MAIAISRRAREFIQRKGGVVTVRLAPRHGCCGGIEIWRNSHGGKR